MCTVAAASTRRRRKPLNFNELRLAFFGPLPIVEFAVERDRIVEQPPGRWIARLLVSCYGEAFETDRLTEDGADLLVQR